MAQESCAIILPQFIAVCVMDLSFLRFLILSLLVGFFMLTLLKNNGLYSVKTKIFQSILSILLVNCGGYRLVRTLVYRFCG